MIEFKARSVLVNIFSQSKNSILLAYHDLDFS